MKNPIEYIIVTVPFHADAATHEDLARKMNEKLIGIPRCCPAILHGRVLLDRFFDCFTDFAGVLLNPTKQFLGLAFDALEFVIRELGSLAPFCFNLPLMMLRSPLISSFVIKFRDFDIECSVQRLVEVIPWNGSTVNEPIALQ